MAKARLVRESVAVAGERLVRLQAEARLAPELEAEQEELVMAEEQQ